MESCSVNYTNIRVFVKCAELNQTFAMIVAIDTFDGQKYIVLADLELLPPTISSGKRLDWENSKCVHQLYMSCMSVDSVWIMYTVHVYDNMFFELVHSSTVADTASPSPAKSETCFSVNNG